MASLFGFRTRSPQRDRETDRERFARLDNLLEEIAAQISAERNGLERRYSESSVNAGFLADAIDNEEAATGYSARLAAMTDDLINYENRLAALSRQIALLHDLRARSRAIFQEQNEADSVPKKASGDH